MLSWLSVGGVSEAMPILSSFIIVAGTVTGVSVYVIATRRGRSCVEAAGLAAGTGVATAGAAYVAGPLAVKGAAHAAGFSSGGVAANSFAAGWQSSIGNVVKGGLFALLQSLGSKP